MYVMKDEIEESMNEASREELLPGFSTLSRGLKRRTDFINEKCIVLKNHEEL